MSRCWVINLYKQFLQKEHEIAKRIEAVAFGSLDHIEAQGTGIRTFGGIAEQSGERIEAVHIIPS